MARPNITRTYGPIHFEDLDPHRFEDLVRELIYDYKSWQSIEATGRSGNDDGFDIRAFERAEEPPRSGDEEEEAEVRPMSGNLWMIQCKREKELGPKRVEAIIAEGVNQQNPPYGYILAAPANFSKDSYDVFRSELQQRGVMEFYLWGKAELEDMLHLPKNDRILFTFFGVSLVSRKRSLATEVRFTVANKNKLMRVFGERIHHQPVLLRDLNDTNYPYQNKYRDFKTHPKWREFAAVGFHPLGLILRVKEFYAYLDQVKKEWDCTDAVNQVHRQSEREEEMVEKQQTQKNVAAVWERFPRANQAKLIVNGLVRFNEMAVIDDKGDASHEFPHIFVDFHGPQGPFEGYFEFLEKNGNQILLDEYKRVNKFPDTFQEPQVGKVHQSKSVAWNEKTLARFKNEYDRFYSLYDCDGRYNFLNQGDVIPISKPADATGGQDYIQITCKMTMKIKDYLELRFGELGVKEAIEEQIGRKVRLADNINVYEFKRAYEWQFNRKAKP